MLCTVLNKGKLPKAKENTGKIPKTVYNVLVTAIGKTAQVTAGVDERQMPERRRVASRKAKTEPHSDRANILVTATNFAKGKGNERMKKENFKKKIMALGCALLLVFSFVACGSNDANGGENSPQANLQKQTDESALLAEYQEAMQKMLDEKVFPNGDPMYTNEDDDETVWGDNQFAVTDIDGDGELELLINFGNAPMVGEQFFVFRYDPDSDTFEEELREFPAVTFYDNGYVTVQASHNQGLAGEFWPYAIYRYNADQDAYEQIYYIDAWDKTYFAEDADGNAYPEDVDTSKTGIVYYIYTDVTKKVAPVDKSVYDEVVADTYGTAAETKVNYQDITQENIDAIA